MAFRAGWTPPEEFDEYKLLRSLGRGGMGQVWLAQDTLLDRLVAVKFIAAVEPDADARRRFLIEARAAARLQHPNVVGIYRVGLLHTRHYIVSEFVRGEALSDLPGPVPWKRALELGIGLSQGLAAAHRVGILHRDIKSSNAVLTMEGVVKLIDFGLAKLMDVGATARIELDESLQLDPPAQVPREVGGKDPHPVPLPGGEGARDQDLTISRAIDAAPDTQRDLAPPAGEGRPLTRAGAIVGTPIYMARELMTGQPATPRSDIYSLGVILYELVAGSPPYDGLPFVDLFKALSTQGVPPLEQQVPTVSPRFAAIVDRCLRTDPRERFASADDLVQALESLTARSVTLRVPEGNPYRGLLTFEAEHRGLFFGRSTEVRTVVDRLRSQSLVVVTGDSGAGKSSLCRAGVLPQVTEGALGEERQWTVLTVVPGRHPLAALTAALTTILGEPPASAPNVPSDDWQPGDVGRALGRRLGKTAGTLLFLDQLEELVTLAPASEALEAAELLGRLAAGIPGVRLLATVRSDFLARVAALPDLGADLSRALYFLRPMTGEGVREAVEAPARATGAEFESEELVDTLARSAAGAGSLPLLQFALAELWERRDRASNRITASALADIGGVEGALARHADGILASLPPTRRATARRLLVSLVSSEDTRARRTRQEVAATDPDAPATLETLVAGRLLSAREVEGETSYEIAHEALLSGWSTLRGWLDSQSEHRAVQLRLEAAAAEWARLGRGAGALWSAPQLAEAADLDVDGLGEREVAFLRASHDARRRRKLLDRTALVGLLAFAALLYAGLQWNQRRERDQRIAAQVSMARTELRAARGQRRDAARLRTSALARLGARDREEMNGLWARMRTVAHRADEAYAHAGQALERALVFEGRRRSVRRLLAAILYERALLAEEVLDRTRIPELLERLSLYDDEQTYRRRWFAPASLSLRTDPVGARVQLQLYQDELDGVRRPGPARVLGRAPIHAEGLRPGSYLLTIALAGHAEVRYPVLLARREHLEARIDLPITRDVPAGFVYVPPGRFRLGSADEELRSFLETVPEHEARTGGYLIARTETTYAEWIRFLEALPPTDALERMPRAGSGGLQGGLEVRRLEGRSWQLTMQPGSRTYRATAGGTIHYDQRSTGARQRWLRMPISGISAADAEAYTSWLDRSGQVPGARLCSEAEWERAARGADDRPFPHGNVLHDTDANFDATYRKDLDQYGPDEVGSHPASRSPFLVDDLAGNVFEWTTAVVDRARYAIRGGGYWNDRAIQKTMNRETPDDALRDLVVGLRVCATPKLAAP